MSEPTQSVSGGRDLTQGPIGRTLFAFALPVLGSTALQTVNGSVNALWVGRLLGEEALTATGNANNVLFLLLAAAIGLSIAAAILVGQATGRRDLEEAKRVVGAATTYFLVLSVVIGAVGYAVTGPLLTLLDTPAAAMTEAKDYLGVIFLALPVLFLNTFAGMALRGAGDSTTPFRFAGLAVALDIALNPVLILGTGPLPALGITGSALATLLSQAISLVAVALYLRARGFPLLLTGRDKAYYRPAPALLRAITLKGLPMGAQMVVISISGLTMIGIANGYGVSTVAGYSVAMQLWAYCQAPCFAIAAACSAMAAQNIGAGRWDRVDQTAWKGTLIATGLTAAAIAVIYLFERPITQAFLPGDPAAVAVSMRVNLYGLWGWLFFGGVMAVFSVVRAAGAVLAPLAILAAALVAFRIPLVYALEGRLGADAIWISSPAALALTLALSYAYYRYGPWRSASMGASGPQTAEVVASATSAARPAQSAAPAAPPA